LLATKNVCVYCERRYCVCELTKINAAKTTGIAFSEAHLADSFKIGVEDM
jgi:hypothetical protein